MKIAAIAFMVSAVLFVGLALVGLLLLFAR
jgi:hypothetical protein